MRNRRFPARGAELRRTDAGSTLIEILVATFIMGSAILVMVAGIGDLFSTSFQNRTLTTADVVARDYAEALDLAVAQASGQTGAWCSATYAVASTPPTGFTVSAVYGACPATTATTPQFQTVTITATGPSGTAAQLRMVVRET